MRSAVGEGNHRNVTARQTRGKLRRERRRREGWVFGGPRGLKTLRPLNRKVLPGDPQTYRFKVWLDPSN